MHKKIYMYIRIYLHIQTGHPVFSNKKGTCHLVDFAVSAQRKVKIEESEKLYKYLDLARGLKKLRNTNILIVAEPLLNCHRKSEKDSRGIGIRRKNQEHSDIGIVKISKITQKTWGS